MTDKPTSPTAVVKAFLKAIEPLDYDTAVAFLSDDCEYTNPPPLETVRGAAAVRAVVEPFFAPTNFACFATPNPGRWFFSKGSTGTS